MPFYSDQVSAQAGRQVTLMKADGGSSAPSWNKGEDVVVEQVAPLAALTSLRALPGLHRLMGGPLDLPVRRLGTCLSFTLRFVAAVRSACLRTGQAALRDLLAEAMPAWQRMATLLGAADLVRRYGHLIHWDTTATADRSRRTWTRTDAGAACLVKLTMQDRMLLQTLCVRFDRRSHGHLPAGWGPARRCPIAYPQWAARTARRTSFTPSITSISDLHWQRSRQNG